MRLLAVIFSLLVLLALACGGGQVTPASNTDATVKAAVNATVKAQGGNIPTVKPVNTLKPTDAPLPTDTPLPTNTPPPADTPTPAVTSTSTPAPEPIELKGNGPDVVDIDKGAYAAFALISGNFGDAGYFSVTSFTAGGQENLLVNTTDSYVGERPIDFLDGEVTKRFQVEADGEWKITVFPLGAARRINAPGLLEGEGDSVLIIDGSPDVALISGNSGSQYFSVTGYSSASTDLLVNTTDPYNGKVILDPGAVILEIAAIGPWSITLQ